MYEQSTRPSSSVRAIDYGARKSSYVLVQLVGVRIIFMRGHDKSRWIL